MSFGVLYLAERIAARPAEPGVGAIVCPAGRTSNGGAFVSRVDRPERVTFGENRGGRDYSGTTDETRGLDPHVCRPALSANKISHFIRCHFFPLTA